MIRRFYLDLPRHLGGGQMHGRIAHRPGAPWLAMLHQSPSSSVMFEALMAVLGERFALIAPDLPGFGQSDPVARPSVEGFAQAVAFALDAHGVHRAAVFGHHTGASVAVALGVARPDLVSGLALYGAPALDPEMRAALAGFAPVAPLAEDGSHLTALWSRLRARETNAPLALSTREVGLAMQAQSVIRDVYAAVAEYDFDTALQRVSCPMMLMSGDRDSLAACLPRAVALRPDARVEAMADAGGYVCELATSRLAALLEDFLVRCP